MMLQGPAQGKEGAASAAVQAVGPRAHAAGAREQAVPERLQVGHTARTFAQHQGPSCGPVLCICCAAWVAFGVLWICIWLAVSLPLLPCTICLA